MVVRNYGMFVPVLLLCLCLCGCGPRIVGPSGLPGDSKLTECTEVNICAEVRRGVREFSWRSDGVPPGLAEETSVDGRSYCREGTIERGSSKNYDLTFQVTDGKGRIAKTKPHPVQVEPPSAPVVDSLVEEVQAYEELPFQAAALQTDRVVCEIVWEREGTDPDWMTWKPSADGMVVEVGGQPSCGSAGGHHVRFRARDGDGPWSAWQPLTVTVAEVLPPPQDPANCRRVSEDPPEGVGCGNDCEVWLCTDPGGHCPAEGNASILPGFGVWLDRPASFDLNFGRSFSPCDVEMFWIYVDTCGLGYNPDKCAGSEPPNRHCQDWFRLMDTRPADDSWEIPLNPDVNATTTCGTLDKGETRRFRDERHRGHLADGVLQVRVLPDSKYERCRPPCDTYCVEAIRVIIKPGARSD